MTNFKKTCNYASQCSLHCRFFPRFHHSQFFPGSSGPDRSFHPLTTQLVFPETNILKINSSKTKIFQSFKCNKFPKCDYIFQCPLIIYNSKCKNYLKVFIIYNSILKNKACSYCVKITCCFWYAVSGRILDSKRRDPVTQRIQFLNSHVCTEPIKIVHAHCPYRKETHLFFFNNGILVCTMFFLCFA